MICCYSCVGFMFYVLMDFNRLVTNRGHRLHRHLVHFRHDWLRLVRVAVDLVLHLSLAPPVCCSKMRSNCRFHRQSMTTLWNDPTTVAVLEIVIAIATEMVAFEAVAVNVVLTVTVVASVNRVATVTNHVVIAIVKIVTWWYAMMPAMKPLTEMALCCALVLSAGSMASIHSQSKRDEKTEIEMK